MRQFKTKKDSQNGHQETQTNSNKPTNPLVADLEKQQVLYFSFFSAVGMLKWTIWLRPSHIQYTVTAKFQAFGWYAEHPPQRCLKPSLVVLFTSYAPFHWSAERTAFPRSVSVVLPPQPYFVWPQRAESNHTAVRHSDTHSPAVIPPVTRRDERCCPPLWLDDGSARMGTWNSSTAWRMALGFASPDSHAATLNRNLIIKSKVSVSLRVRLTELIDFEGKLLCTWIL